MMGGEGRGGDLDNTVVVVAGGVAVEAEGGDVAVEAEHVAFVARGVNVRVAGREEPGLEQWLQPWRDFFRHCQKFFRLLGFCGEEEFKKGRGLGSLVQGGEENFTRIRSIRCGL